MLKKQYIVSLLAVLLSLSFGSVVMAGEGDYTNMVGTDQFSFESSQTNNEMAIKHQGYDQEQLSLVGTEAGDWKRSANAVDTKAQQAARDHNYDESRLSNVGTEAGNWRYRFDSSESPVCSNC